MSTLEDKNRLQQKANEERLKTYRKEKKVVGKIVGKLVKRVATRFVRMVIRIIRETSKRFLRDIFEQDYFWKHMHRN